MNCVTPKSFHELLSLYRVPVDSNCNVSARFLSVIFFARNAYLQVENSGNVEINGKSCKIPSSRKTFIVSDYVYYEPFNCRKWKDPANVVVHSNVKIIIKHGIHFFFTTSM